MTYGIPQNADDFLGQISGAQPMQAGGMPQIDTNTPSPYGQVGDVLNHFVANKQQQSQQGGMLRQILGMRFQPTQEDRMGAYNQNTAALYVPHVFKSTTPEEQATNRATLELAPYTAAAKLQEGAVAAGGGATGSLVNRLMAENPGMSFKEALYSVQTGFRQGTGLDANGNVMPLPGAIPSKASLAGAEAGARVAGTNTANAQNDLPGIVANANQSLIDIDNLINDPELGAVTGMRGIFPPIPGTPGAATLARLKQVGGQTFLTAYNQLRGGGSITEVEGAKATAAKGRLDQAQSAGDIISALKELKSIVNTGAQVARLKASGNPSAVPPDLGMPTNGVPPNIMKGVATSPAGAGLPSSFNGALPPPPAGFQVMQ